MFLFVKSKRQRSCSDERRTDKHQKTASSRVHSSPDSNTQYVFLCFFNFVLYSTFSSVIVIKSITDFVMIDLSGERLSDDGFK